MTTSQVLPQQEEQEPPCEHRHLTIDSEISGKIDRQRVITITLVCYACHAVRFLSDYSSGFEDWSMPL